MLKALPTALLLFGLGLPPPAPAQFNAAMDAYDGQQYRRAVALFERLAEQGDADAQYMLGRLFAAGNGTLQDYVEAHKWFNLAAAGGHRHAAEARDALAERMDQRQIGQAQDLARRWLDREPASVASAPSAPSIGPERIAVVQGALNDLGYDAGPADGVIGERTREAIRQFQADYGFRPDGNLTEPLLERMREVWTAREQRQQEQQRDQRWPRLVLRDDFSDGDFTRDPRWRVMSGRFTVLPEIGLRSALVRNRAKDDPPKDTKTLRLEALRAFMERAGDQPNQTGSARKPSYGQIYIERPFGDAFYIRLRFSAPQADDTVSFGPYIKHPRGAGYRLVYNADTAAGLALVRFTGDGYRVLQTGSWSPKLTDGRPRELTWQRDRRGIMTVQIDGRNLMRTEDRDRGMKTGFDGFTLVNQGGVCDLHEIEIRGRW